MEDMPAEQWVMVLRALEALRHALAGGYIQHIPAMLASPAVLDELDREHSLSAVERRLSGTWMVMMHLPGGCANQALRSRQLSFFVRWPRSQCNLQVHVLKCAIYDKRQCLLIAFPTHAKPRAQDIETVAEKLRKVLGLKESSRYLATEPIAKAERWFRADGELKKKVKDLILSPALREALSKQTVGSLVPRAAVQPNALREADRPPVDFVLWTRQSNEDARRAYDSIPRQLATMLRSPVLDSLRGTDRIWIFVEMASSSRHALSERRLYASLPRQRPVQLLTVNPDRMTRRASEIAVVREDIELTRGHWFTSGVKVEEHQRPEDWVEVDAELQPQLEEVISIGK